MAKAKHMPKRYRKIITHLKRSGGLSHAKAVRFTQRLRQQEGLNEDIQFPAPSAGELSLLTGQAGGPRNKTKPKKLRNYQASRRRESAAVRMMKEQA